MIRLFWLDYFIQNIYYKKIYGRVSRMAIKGKFSLNTNIFNSDYDHNINVEVRQEHIYYVDFKYLGDEIIKKKLVKTK